MRQIANGGLVRRAKLALLVVAAALALLTLGPPAALAAEGPTWKIVSVSDPTHFLQPHDQVDELEVGATSGSYGLTVEYFEAEYIRAGLVPRELLIGKTSEIAYNASAATVQLALEEGVGTGNVTVSKAGSAYVITFTGALAGRGIELRTALDTLEGGSGLSVKEATIGNASGELIVSATNVGGSPAKGSSEPITISDSLPPDLTAVSISGHDAYTMGSSEPGVMGCSTPPPAHTLTCTYPGIVAGGDTLVVSIKVQATSAMPSASAFNQATVSGGGTAPASASGEVVLSSTPASFGIASGSLFAATSTSQAGAHANVMTAFTLNTSELNLPPTDVKDINFDLPPGLVGSTVGMPRCKMATVVNDTSACPSDTIVGTVLTKYTEHAKSPTADMTEEVLFPVFNIEPAPGEPAAFAFDAVLFPVRLDTSVLSDGDYNVRVGASDLTEAASTISASFTFWGVPADHQGIDEENPNETYFIRGSASGRFGGPAKETTTQEPFLTNPTQCSTPLQGTLIADPWSDPEALSEASTSMGTMTGCGLLPFTSLFSMLPDTLEAGAPAGYTLKLGIPQSNEPDGLATPNVKNVSTTLPIGTVISPSAAWGLAACSDAQFFGSETERGLPRPATPGECPRESQVGTVEVKTPALPLPLQGQVFLGEPECGMDGICTPQDAEDGKMVRLLLQLVGEGESGIVVKLEGKAEINQQTGQITAIFDQNPQLPFSELKLSLGGGPRATLANQRVCGAASTSMDLTPWSTPFTPDSTPTSTFEIYQDCFAPQFNPSFIAGTTSIQAGEYSPFTVSFGRQDADEFLNGVQMQMAPGLLGTLAAVTQCKEPQAAEGTCGPQSLIGHTQILTGPGADPFLVSGGQVFLTESYKGAPYGLSIVVPAKAGPYTLSGTTGKGTVVVRAAIDVDPNDAHLTVTSDPLPTELDGIPLQLKVVNVTIDRPGFTFNPTSCAKMAIDGTLTSAEGMTTTVSSPFQVTNCRGLVFKPEFEVSTSGRTSRANGASLDAKVIYPSIGPKQANIAKVKVELPKQLPSRLATLQKSCPAITFESNPANCPVASVVGITKATTPILPVTLAGPVYFVSHGDEAFPSLIIVLQGDGVRVDLVGATFISKAGITSSTFKTVPDVPISSFELYLPEGKYSALAANGDLCTSKLAMPTMFVAQNGAEIHEKTKISVTGCPKIKTTAKKKKAKKRKGRRASRASRHDTGRGD